jgi:hypothetical protein
MQRQYRHTKSVTTAGMAHARRHAVCPALIWLYVLAGLQVLVYGGATFQDLWDSNQGYLALWVMQRLTLLLLQCSAAHATAMSFKDQAWLSPSAIRLMNSIRRM